MLIGAVPFEAPCCETRYAEMLRIIREEEAPPLSRKLTTMGAAASDIAARRQTDPASLRRIVDGDLNSITMKALEKARERRYTSVAEFAADIQRYMEHRPVLASPPSRAIPDSQISAQTQARRNRHGGCGCVSRFRRRHGLVAVRTRFSSGPKLADKRYDSPGGFREYHW